MRPFKRTKVAPGDRIHASGLPKTSGRFSGPMLRRHAKGAPGAAAASETTARPKQNDARRGRTDGRLLGAVGGRNRRLVRFGHWEERPLRNSRDGYTTLRATQLWARAHGSPALAARQHERRLRNGSGSDLGADGSPRRAGPPSRGHRGRRMGRAVQGPVVQGRPRAGGELSEAAKVGPTRDARRSRAWRPESAARARPASDRDRR